MVIIVYSISTNLTNIGLTDASISVTGQMGSSMAREFTSRLTGSGRKASGRRASAFAG